MYSRNLILNFISLICNSFATLGGSVSDSVTSSMVEMYPNSPFSFIAAVVVMITPFSKYALVLSPVLYSLEVCQFIFSANN